MIKFHTLIQRSDDWYAARCGLLTASEMKLIVTPATLKPASNDKERAHLYELLAQRITSYVEPSYQSDDMARGVNDEIEVRRLYAEHYAPVRDDIGFITNDEWGFTLGYSPDGLVGDDGQLEAKSRRQKYQVQTVVEDMIEGGIPAEFVVQVQTGLLVSKRSWCDFVSYCGGLPMLTLRIFPDPKVQGAIIGAATAFEARLADKLARYRDTVAKLRAIPTERLPEEIFA